jgi:hypothetical protein
VRLARLLRARRAGGRSPAAKKRRLLRSLVPAPHSVIALFGGGAPAPSPGAIFARLRSAAVFGVAAQYAAPCVLRPSPGESVALMPRSRADQSRPALPQSLRRVTVPGAAPPLKTPAGGEANA